MVGYTKCSEPSCASRPKQGIVFRRFPKDENLAQKWLQFLPPGFKVLPSTFLCEKHFSLDQFEKVREDGKRKLKESAIPSQRKAFQPQARIRDITNTQAQQDNPPIVIVVPVECDVVVEEPSNDIPVVLESPNSSPRKKRVYDETRTDRVQPLISADVPLTPAPALSEADLKYELLLAQFKRQEEEIKSLKDRVIENESTIEAMAQVNQSLYHAETSFTEHELQKINDYDNLLEKYHEQSEQIQEMKEVVEEKKTAIAELNALLSTKNVFRAKFLAVSRSRQRLLQQVRRDLYSPHCSIIQMRALMRKHNRGYKWTSNEVREGLILKMKSGTKAYHAWVSKYPLLPSVRKLQREVQFIKFTDSGILHEMFDMLESQVLSMSDMERDCVVVFDEVEIAEGKVYSVSLGKMVGDATFPGHSGNAKKGLVFILAGVARRWKLAVAVYLTSPSSRTDKYLSESTGEMYKQILNSVINKAHQIGLKPAAAISDMGADNLALWRACGVTGGREIRLNVTIPSPDESYRICVMPDPIHLMKNIKSALENNTTFTLADDIVEKHQLHSNVVDYRHIDDLYELESNNELKVAFRLKPSNLHVGKHFKKMNVGTCRAVLCHRTGVGLQMLANEKEDLSYFTTAFFVMLLNTFFELVTCRYRGLALNKRNPKVYNEALGLIKTVGDIFHTMTVGWGGPYKPIQRGMRVLCASLLHLSDHFFDDRKYSFLMLGRFNSDCIENIFSLIRFRQTVPHAVAFLQCLKVITLAQFSEFIKGCNYEFEDSSELPTDDFLKIARERAEERATTQFCDSLEELLAVPIDKLTEEDYRMLNDWEKAVIYDMAGSVVAHLKKANHRLCQKCINSAKWKGPPHSLHPYAVVTEMKEYTYLKSERRKDELLQFYVSNHVFKAVLTAEITFRLHRAQAMRFSEGNILDYFVKNLMYVWDRSSLLNCHNLGLKILTYFLTGRLHEQGRIHREEVKVAKASKSTQICMSSKSAAGKEAAEKI